MRCGQHKTQGPKLKRLSPHKAEARRFNKAKKLGPLGSDDFNDNSTIISCKTSSHGSHTGTMNSTHLHVDYYFNKKNKRWVPWGAPPHKRDFMESSRYWAAHNSCVTHRVSGPGLKEKSNSRNVSQQHKSRPKEDEGESQAKKA